MCIRRRLVTWLRCTVIVYIVLIISLQRVSPGRRTLSDNSRAGLSTIFELRDRVRRQAKYLDSEFDLERARQVAWQTYTFGT